MHIQKLPYDGHQANVDVMISQPKKTRCVELAYLQAVHLPGLSKNKCGVLSSSIGEME